MLTAQSRVGIATTTLQGSYPEYWTIMAIDRLLLK